MGHPTRYVEGISFGRSVVIDPANAVGAGVVVDLGGVVEAAVGRVVVVADGARVVVVGGAVVVRGNVTVVVVADAASGCG
jgi:hypothetical protein